MRESRMIHLVEGTLLVAKSRTRVPRDCFACTKKDGKQKGRSSRRCFWYSLANRRNDAASVILFRNLGDSVEKREKKRRKGYEVGSNETATLRACKSWIIPYDEAVSFQKVG